MIAWEVARKRIISILQATTVEFRKDEAVQTRRVGNLEVTDVFNMPSTEAVNNDGTVDIIDVYFINVGVHKEAAAERRTEFIELLGSYPDKKRLAGGVSYIEMGAELGSQDYALMFFALGKHYGLWDIMTPMSLGFPDDEKSRELVGSGFLFMSGFQNGSE